MLCPHSSDQVELAYFIPLSLTCKCKICQRHNYLQCATNGQKGWTKKPVSATLSCFVDCIVMVKIPNYRRWKICHLWQTQVQLQTWFCALITFQHWALQTACLLKQRNWYDAHSKCWKNLVFKMNPLKQYDMGNVNTAEEPAKTFMASVYIVLKSFFKYNFGGWIWHAAKHPLKKNSWHEMQKISI